MKNKILLIVISVFISICGIAQGPPPPPPPPDPEFFRAHPELVDTMMTIAVPPDSGEVFTFAEVMPRNDQMMKFVTGNFKYPTQYRDTMGCVNVYVGFIVEKDGSLSNIEVLKGLPSKPLFDKEVVRVFSLMPNWIPGEMNGRPVRVQMKIPIRLNFQ